MARPGHFCEGDSAKEARAESPAARTAPFTDRVRSSRSNLPDLDRTPNDALGSTDDQSPTLVWASVQE
jgi:hypothetical protein